jgi:hypothetical protein
VKLLAMHMKVGADEDRRTFAGESDSSDQGTHVSKKHACRSVQRIPHGKHDTAVYIDGARSRHIYVNKQVYL